MDGRRRRGGGRAGQGDEEKLTAGRGGGLDRVMVDSEVVAEEVKETGREEDGWGWFKNTF